MGSSNGLIEVAALMDSSKVLRSGLNSTMRSQADEQQNTDALDQTQAVPNGSLVRRTPSYSRAKH